MVESLVSVRNSLALLWYKEIKNWLYYQDFTPAFVKMYKIPRTWRVFAEPVTNYNNNNA